MGWRRRCALLALCLPAAGQATCQIKGPTYSTYDLYVAPLRFGRVNLSSAYLQPPGTLLASAVAPPTHFTKDGAHGGTVMWECDQADVDAGKVYFLVSTNGDDRVGGYHETGLADGLPGVYATAYEHIGIKLSMAGTVFSRHWQPVALQTYEPFNIWGKARVRIRLKDIPVLEAQLYRISELPELHGAPSDWCHSRTYGLTKPTPAGRTYPWCAGKPQPSGYVQLVGPGIAHDEIGWDHASKYEFWGAFNGFGYGMWGSGTTVSNRAGCAVRSHDVMVNFPRVSAQQLMDGSALVQQFTVQVECDDAAESGVASGQVALGIQVSRNAYDAAKALGLVNASEGVSHLLADDYDDPASAKGVGVTLQNPAMVSGNLWFIGEPSLLANASKGSHAGWYPVQAGAASAPSPVSGHSYWHHTFTATLGRIGGHDVTPGHFKATATILVKMQ